MRAHPFRVHLHKCIKDCNVIMSVWPQPEIWPECTAEKLSAHQGRRLIFLNTEGEPVCATRPKKGKKKYSANSITLAAFTFLVTSQSPQLFHKLSYKKMEGKQESTSLPNQTHASFNSIIFSVNLTSILCDYMGFYPNTPASSHSQKVSLFC